MAKADPDSTSQVVGPLAVAGADVEPMKHSRWLLPVCIFLLALVVRLLYLWEASGSPFFEYRGLDARTYHQHAMGFCNGTWPSGRPFFWPPLYPMFLGVFYQIVGQGIVALKVVQAVLGSLSCVLVYLLGRTIFPGRFVGVAAAVMCCLCGTMIVFDGQLLSGNLDVFLQLLTILVLLVAGRRGGPVWWALAGVGIGLCAINRGGILLFLPIALVWLYAQSRWGWNSGIARDGQSRKHPFFKSALALLLPVGLLIAPVSWHNAKYDAFGEGVTRTDPPGPERGSASPTTTLKRILTGKFALLATPLGLNFHLGNHWETYHLNDPNHPQSFAHYTRLIQEPFNQGLTSAAAQSRYLVRGTVEDILESPADFAKLMGLKLFHLLNGDERRRNLSVYAFRQHSVILSALLWKKVIAFPAGLIIPLGLLGVVLACRDWRRHFPIVGLLLAQGAFVLAFFVTARYRLPSLPLLAIYAAFTLQEVVRCIRLGPRPKAAVLVGLLLLCNTAIGPMENAHAAYEHQNLAIGLATQGRIETAVEHFTEAVRLSPQTAMIHANLANALALQGRTNEALTHYTESLRIDPANAKARSKLGQLLAQQGRLPEAAEHLSMALDVRPEDAPAQRTLADLYARQGNLPEAQRHYSEALRFAPDDRLAHRGLGEVYIRLGRPPEAGRHYSVAVRLRPEDATARTGLGMALGMQGKFAEAVEQFSEVSRIDPASGQAHFLRGGMLEALGRVREAVAAYRESLRLNPDQVRVANGLAWLLATHPDGEVRDGAEALELSQWACGARDQEDPMLLDTLAAAYAEEGRFTEAAATAHQALESARGGGDAGLVEEIGQRLKLYQAGHPYRQATP